MTKEHLIQYLRVNADLADKPGDGIAHVAVVPLRQAIALLMLEQHEPTAPQRPANFGFAMEFLGDPEAKDLLAYIEALERAVNR
jgi:hypothetical protein